MDEFLIFDVKTTATDPGVFFTATSPTGRHARDHEPGEGSAAAEAFRIAARGVRAQADRDWVARRLGRPVT